MWMFFHKGITTSRNIVNTFRLEKEEIFSVLGMIRTFGKAFTNAISYVNMGLHKI